MNMANTNTDTSSSSSNVPTQSSTPVDTNSPSPLNALLLGAKQIPLLTAYTGSNWIGILPNEWFKLLEELFVAENITSDALKLNTAWRHVHSSEGSARSILASNIDIRNSVTWDSFKENVLNLLTPSHDSNAFLAFNKFARHSWDHSTPIPVLLSQIQKHLDQFLASVKASCDIDFTERQRFVLLYSKLADALPLSYNRFLFENFDISLSVTQQQKKYLAKRDFNTSDLNVNAIRQANSNSTHKNFGNYSSQFNTSANRVPYKKVKSSFPSHSNHSRKMSMNNKQPSPGFDPKNTPFCLRCERWGHLTKQCVFKAFCSLCFQYHSRGTKQRCFKTTWDRMSSSALKRFQLIPVSLSQKQFRPNQHSFQNNYAFANSANASQFHKSYTPHGKQPQHFSNRRNINHVQDYIGEDQGQPVVYDDDTQDSYDFTTFSQELDSHPQDYDPSFHTQIYENINEQNFNSSQNFLPDRR